MLFRSPWQPHLRGVVASSSWGGTVASGTHYTKAGTRAVVNTSPEPFSNWAVSVTEDVALPAGLWLANAHPLIFIGVLALLAIAALLLLRLIVRGLVALYRRF